VQPRDLEIKHFNQFETLHSDTDLVTDGREGGNSTPDLVTDGTESGISTPLSSLCNDTLDNIYPLLLVSAPAADAPFQAPVHGVIDVDSLLDIDERESHLAEIAWSAKYNGATQSTCQSLVIPAVISAAPPRSLNSILPSPLFALLTCLRYTRRPLAQLLPLPS